MVPDQASTTGQLAPRYLLKTVVGSRAHGTSTPESDTDVRCVYLLPTSTILSVGNVGNRGGLERNASWDQHNWELATFLDRAVGGSPTTLEVMLTPPLFSSDEGEAIRLLFPHVLGKKRVFAAFRSYAQESRRTILSKVSGRRVKARGDYLRVLFNGVELLTSGTMTVRIVDTAIGGTVVKARRGLISQERVLEIGDELERRFEEAYASSILPERANKAEINRFLLGVRWANW